MESFAAKFFNANKKNTFNPKLIATFRILMTAYRVGCCVTRNQANGMITKASKSKIQMTRLIYFTSISIKCAI